MSEVRNVLVPYKALKDAIQVLEENYDSGELEPDSPEFDSEVFKIYKSLKDSLKAHEKAFKA
jgi:hypothetical protein